ncbi:L-galactose dehydrogenase [Paenibacillus sp. UNCCL117]|uniref:aldo/keto reductase n=1 Tax=unclassified Paenibacillus TaxID=185978 RepID=UPI000889B499|nr:MULTISPECIES: aldo/keto reductase [unclassified Paenibacillus]SDD96649.1 L-galactose dehydrogenase [Paenibacillus sp. cl123]SFW56340.1 L-galactose dehydrogenase [Paenibacillus sp. UNCCL117]
MEYTTFGRTGLRVSKLGLGGAPLGGVFGEADEREVEKMIHEAIDGGINLIDTAPSYGDGESERRIGQALDGGRRNQVVLATKAVGPGKSFDYASTVRSVEQSLARLRTDWIDLLQIHDAEQVPFETILEETLPALEKLREDGKIRYIGISSRLLPLLGRFVKLNRFDSIQFYARYMLIDHTAKDELLPLATEADIGVINGSVLGLGLLADTPAPFLNRKIVDEAALRISRLQFLRKSEPFGLVEPAMRFSLSEPRIHVTLTGAATREVLRANMALCDGRGLEPEELRRVYELFQGQSLFPAE